MEEKTEKRGSDAHLSTACPLGKVKGREAHSSSDQRGESDTGEASSRTASVWLLVLVRSENAIHGNISIFDSST